jgi:hypothetical protein
VGTRNDQVFQLSLTEIAFTVAFILLLLLGYVVFKEQSDRLAAEAALASAHSSEQTAEALRAAKEELSAELKGAGVANPDEVITKLVAAENVRAERDRLKKQVEDLDGRLSALSELQSELEQAAKVARPEITKKEVDRAISFTSHVDKLLNSEEPKPSALHPVPEERLPKSSSGRDKDALAEVKESINLARELRTQLKRQLASGPKPRDEVQALKDVISDAEKYAQLTKNGVSVGTIQKENSDLRGQVAFLKNRLDARGGRDHPPCWADENGKVEYLFSIELGQGAITITPAWPVRRDGEARELPGVIAAVEGSHSYQQFSGVVQPILSWSKKQDPECRHYVQLKSSITDAIQSDRARLMVENYFYKAEARR